MRNIFFILILVVQITAFSFFVLPEKIDNALGAVSALQTAQGGTGTTTIPALGDVLVGQSNGTYAPVATSTLGISGGSGSQTPWTSAIDGAGYALTNAGAITGTTFTATSTTATSTFAGGIAVETSGLVYNYSTNNLGIGLANPLKKLQIRGADAEYLMVQGTGDTDGSSSGISFISTSGQTTDAVNSRSASIAGIRRTGNSFDLTFSMSDGTNSLERARFQGSTGNFGIGTTSPYSKLSVAGQVVAQNYEATSTTATSTFAGGFIAGGSEGLIVLQNGRVSIATTSSTYQLNVGDSINIDTFGAYRQGNTPILYSSSTNSSTLVGAAAPWMLSTSTALYSTAIGFQAMGTTPTTGGDLYNTAVGYQTMQNNVVGTQNTAVGAQALRSAGGSWNTAVGMQALTANTGTFNTAVGRRALGTNTSGANGIGIGVDALYYNTTGQRNFGLGYSAGVGDGTSQDSRSVKDTRMLFIGYQATRDSAVASTTVLTTSAAIGYNAVVGCSNCLVLGGLGTDSVNVGIGTSTPYSKLSVAGQVVASDYVATTSTSTFAGITTTGLAITGTGTTTAANGFNIASGCYAIAGVCVTGSIGGSISGWATTSSSVAGQLNLYPTNATDILNIGGSATTSSEFWFDPNTVQMAVMGSNGTSSTVMGSSNNQWVLGTSDSDKSFRIASSTRQLDGITAALTLSKSGVFTVANYVASSPTATSTFATDMVFSGLTASAGTPSSLCLNTATNEVTVNAALTCTVSARDQKNSIKTLSLDALNMVMKLNPVQFKYNDADRLRYGFIADEVQAVDPRLGDAYDKDGNARSLDIPALTSLNTKAIQELNDKVDAIDNSSPQDDWQYWIISLLLVWVIRLEIKLRK